MPGCQPASVQAQSLYMGATSPYGTRQGVDYSEQPVHDTARTGAEGYPVSSNYEGQVASYGAMVNAPAAGAMGCRTMTYDDVVVESLICFSLLPIDTTTE